jgi:hypothetical protein
METLPQCAGKEDFDFNRNQPQFTQQPPAGDNTAQAMRASLFAVGYHHDVLVCPEVKCIKPGSDWRSVALDPQHGRSGTMDQDLAQVVAA